MFFLSKYLNRQLFFACTLCLSMLPTLAHALVTLSVIEKKIIVNDRETTIFAIAQKDGTLGLRAKKGDMFDVRLENTLSVPTSVHWHGLILPNAQDGVADITQFAIYPGQSYDYHFPILQAGTFWMHSHVGLQEQKLLAAPLILLSAEDMSKADQEAVIMLSDFSFRSPEAIYQDLKCHSQMSSMPSMEGKTVNMPEMSSADVVEVNYDAFLANYRTLDSPEIVETQPGKKIRLRFINAASATNFLLLLGQLEGEAIAVDGNEIKPLRGKQFELGVAQRIDILVTIPEQGGAFPILAQGEGTDKQAGILLLTEGVTVPSLSAKASHKIGPLTNTQEGKLEALVSLPEKAVDKSVVIELGGDMANYTWTVSGQSWPEITPVLVEKGQRVEIVFKNVSSMAHPMHLHGHVYQITAIDGKPLKGAMRDTVLVMPKSSVTIQFDADNPGVWPLHCHILYHLEAGMLTVLRYEDFIQSLPRVNNRPLFKLALFGKIEDF